MLKIASLSLLIGCNGIVDTLDGSADVVAAPDSGCAQSIETYCATQTCPTLAEDLATCGFQRTVTTGCGLTVVSNYGIDTGQIDAYEPDGGLVTVYTYFDGVTSCRAGTPSTSPCDDASSQTVSHPSCDASPD